MQYVRLGKSGVKVSRICLGTAFRAWWDGHIEENTCIENIQRAVDLGCNFLDSANSYFEGRCEEVVGKAVKIMKNRDDLILTSKVHSMMGDGPNDYGLSRFHIMREVENSLRRMGTDRIDLYQLHRYSRETPLEETFAAMNDLVRQGKVRYVGCSNYAGWEIATASAAAERRGYMPFLVSQSPYNLFERSLEAEVLPCCRHHGLSIAAYSPLAQGVLTGKYRRGAPIPRGTRAWKNPSPVLARYMTGERLETVERLDAWTRDQGRRLSELAIAWLLDKSYVCTVLVAVTSIEQLEANVAATDWTLSPDQVQEVEAIVAGSGGY
jgi:aryl-alcohol dehydrogenase-like predicted oxidoreductase